VNVSKYTLSPNAASSIADIKAFTVSKFGPRQAQRYIENLRDCFNFLVEHPELGTNRDEVKAGYHNFIEGSHTIYYKIIGGRIVIMDILRQSMEPKRHLND